MMDPPGATMDAPGTLPGPLRVNPREGRRPIIGLSREATGNSDRAVRKPDREWASVDREARRPRNRAQFRGGLKTSVVTMNAPPPRAKPGGESARVRRFGRAPPPRARPGPHHHPGRGDMIRAAPARPIGGIGFRDKLGGPSSGRSSGTLGEFGSRRTGALRGAGGHGCRFRPLPAGRFPRRGLTFQDGGG